MVSRFNSVPNSAYFVHLNSWRNFKFGRSSVHLRKSKKVPEVHSFYIQFGAEFGILCPFKCMERFQVRYEFGQSSEIQEGARSIKFLYSIRYRIWHTLTI